MAVAGIATLIFTTHRAGVQLEEAALAQLNAQRMAVLARITGEARRPPASEARRLPAVSERNPPAAGGTDG
jgi:hypothetical protein